MALGMDSLPPLAKTITWLIGGDDEIQNGQLETLFRFEQQLYPASAVFGKLQEKLPLMTSVGQVPEIPRNEMSVCACY